MTTQEKIDLIASTDPFELIDKIWHQEAEIERLRSVVASYAMTERSVRNETIEQCASAVEAYLADADHYCDARSEVAAAIRALIVGTKP